MAELADAPDLGSGGEILRGSSPLPGTFNAAERIRARESQLDRKGWVQRTSRSRRSLHSAATSSQLGRAVLDFRFRRKAERKRRAGAKICARARLSAGNSHFGAGAGDEFLILNKETEHEQNNENQHTFF